MTTTGAFLKEKMRNMAAWVRVELGDLISERTLKMIHDMTELEATYAASYLLDDASVPIAHRDWPKLIRLVSESSELKPLQAIALSIHARPQMHEKFWRYLDLFCEVIRNSKV